MATNYYDDEEDDFETVSEDSAIKQLRKVNRALEKRAKELETELHGLKSQTRQRTVKDVLQAKGLNPKIAAFIPQDIDTSEDAITQWITEYGDVFGAAQTTTQEQPNKSSEAAAMARINNAVSTGATPDIDMDAMSKVMSANSKEELDALLGFN